MRVLSSFMALCFLATGASAEAPMSAAEFEAYVRGKTLTFSANGQVYGIEEYLEGRRVRWAYVEGECEDGVWYPQGEMICFVYENIAEPQCWSFFDRGGGLMARYENRDTGTTLFETRQSDAPLLCRGPEVGV